MLRESVYRHLGLAWFFDRPLKSDLPLGGHNVRNGWYPILVEHSQYAPHLGEPAVTAVFGSVSLATDFVHPVHGTQTRDHTPEELARIIWEDERRSDPSVERLSVDATPTCRGLVPLFQSVRQSLMTSLQASRKLSTSKERVSQENVNY